MARATMEGIRVIDAARAAIQVFSDKDDEKTLNTIVEREKLLGTYESDGFWAGVVSGVEKYRSSPLTDADLDKIAKHDAEIARIEEEIAKINAKVLKSYEKAASDAMKAGDFVVFQQLGLEMKQASLKATEKERKAIEVEQKCIVALKSKQDDAGIGGFTETTGVHAGSDTETGGNTRHPFENQRFKVVSTRKSLAYSATWYIDTEHRQIFVELLGDGWNPQLKAESVLSPLFAGFYVQTSGKGAINSRSSLARANYTWITIAQTEKPKSVEDLYEVTHKMNKRLINGNPSEKYSSGAVPSLRIVEDYESDAPDAGSQVKAEEQPEIAWDALEEQRNIINALFDAETDQSDESDAEADEDAENSEETVNPAEKAA